MVLKIFINSKDYFTVEDKKNNDKMTSGKISLIWDS